MRRSLDRMVEFNNCLMENATKTTPPLTLVDTTDVSVADTVAAVAKWIGERSVPSSAGAALE